MRIRKIKVLMLAVVALFALSTFSPALADKPTVWEGGNEYDYLWFSCGDFDVWNVGVHEFKIKLFIEFPLLNHHNAQSQFHGKIINMTTGKYLVEDAFWTWNVHYQDNISTKSILSGTTWKIKYPNGGVIWQDNGVEKYVGFYVDLTTDPITYIFTDPYHVAGKKPDYGPSGINLVTAICDALR